MKLRVREGARRCADLITLGERVGTLALGRRLIRRARAGHIEQIERETQTARERESPPKGGEPQPPDFGLRMGSRRQMIALPGLVGGRPLLSVVGSVLGQEGGALVRRP